LDDAGDGNAHQNAFEGCVGDLLEDAAHLVSGHGLQVFAHHVHTVDEEREAANKVQEVKKCHGWRLLRYRYLWTCYGQGKSVREISLAPEKIKTLDWFQNLAQSTLKRRIWFFSISGTRISLVGLW